METLELWETENYINDMPILNNQQVYMQKRNI